MVLTYCLKNCSGDQDSVIPLTGSRTLVQDLAHNMGLKTTTPYRVWFEGQQVSTAQTDRSFSCKNEDSFSTFITDEPTIKFYRLEAGLRYTVKERCPSPPSEEHPMRRRSRSRNGPSCSSGPSFKASLCLKHSHDEE